MFYTVHALYNKDRDKIYVGQTSNLPDRLKRHNGLLQSKKSSFTKRNGGKWELLHTEKIETRSDAIQREKQLKGFRGREFVRRKLNRIVRP